MDWTRTSKLVRVGEDGSISARLGSRLRKEPSELEWTEGLFALIGNLPSRIDPNRAIQASKDQLSVLPNVSFTGQEDARKRFGLRGALDDEDFITDGKRCAGVG